jgi:hypothetical protein
LADVTLGDYHDLNVFVLHPGLGVNEIRNLHDDGAHRFSTSDVILAYG